MSRPLLRASANAVDWLRVERWHQDLLAGRIDQIRAVFTAAGLGRTDLIRSPAPEAVQAATNRFLLEYWLGECGADGSLPPVSAVDPVRLAPALGRVLVVEPVDGGADFRYRLYGSVTAAFVNLEMTGKLLSDHPVGPEHVCFGMALYRALMERPEPVLAIFVPAVANYARWERLVLPFVNKDGTVSRFVVGNIPFGRDGCELQA